MSDEKNIFKAMMAISRKIEPIAKSQRNQQQGYDFRGIDDMYNELQPLFTEFGVFIMSEVLESKREERATAKGGLLIYTILKVRFTFFAEDGSSVSSVMQGEGMDSADKSSNKAESAALKYCLMQTFLIPTKELKNTDPDKETNNLAPNTQTEHGSESTNGIKKTPVSDKFIEKAIERIKKEPEFYDKLMNDNFIFTDEQYKKLLKAKIGENGQDKKTDIPLSADDLGY